MASHSSSQTLLNQGENIPRYTIDLSSPPSQRYNHIVADFKAEITSLVPVFDSLVEDFLPSGYVIWIKRLAKLCLHRLYTREETEEIRGISRASGVDMYLLVCLNVLLDLLMGCTSGTVMSNYKDSHRNSHLGNSHAQDQSMLHFRTLDWFMDPLRKIVVQLEYVRSGSANPTEVLATSITYAGFIGVLTGVRKGLSMSLNFRPNHNVSGSRTSNFRFYASHLLVLLGLRRSISSLLRQVLVPPDINNDTNSEGTGLDNDPSQPPSLAYLLDTLPSLPTTSAYLIFSDGRSSLTLEKDHRTAITNTSSSFAILTNHDLSAERRHPQEKNNNNNSKVHHHINVISGIDDNTTDAEALSESIDRRSSFVKRYEKHVQAQKRQANRAQRDRERIEYLTQLQLQQQLQAQLAEERVTDPESEERHCSHLRRRRLRRSSNTTTSSGLIIDNSTYIAASSIGTAQSSALLSPTSHSLPAPTTVPFQTLQRWLLAYPTTNACTHFGCIMDPRGGTVVWARRYREGEVHDENEE